MWPVILVLRICLVQFYERGARVFLITEFLSRHLVLIHQRICSQLTIDATLIIFKISHRWVFTRMLSLDCFDSTF